MTAIRLDLAYSCCVGHGGSICPILFEMTVEVMGGERRLNKNRLCLECSLGRCPNLGVDRGSHCRWNMPLLSRHLAARMR
jgi:hypothetical protein